MTLTAIYVRQSLDKQEGIDRQLARTRALATQRGWTVAQEYEDNAASASKVRGAKTAWAQMLKDAQAGKFTCVIAVDLDRLIRNQRDLLTLIDLKLAVVTVDGEIDLSTADGEFRASMMAAIARFEVQRKGERQKRANAHRVAAGRPVPGRRRFGYETDGTTPREPEAVVVRRVFEDFTNGATLYSISRKLNEEGVPTGSDAKPEWAQRRIRDMLGLAAYGGQVMHQGVISEGSGITALVPRETAETARAILADPARMVSPGNRPKHLLSNIAVCGTCGGPLIYTRGYRCAQSNGGHVFIQKASLDRIVAEEVSWAFLMKKGVDEAIRALLQESADLSARRTAATELAMVPGIDMARVRKELADIDQKSTEVAQAISRERGTMASADLAAEVRRMWTDTKADDADQAGWYQFWATLGIERQREIVKSMFSVTVNTAKGIKPSPLRDFDRTDVKAL
jgi:site-specific DNA recombinase